MDDGHKFSILIVDDEKSNINVLNHILKADYTLYIAKSGQAALKRAAEDKPDLILLDIIMPDMSGFEVLRQLKSSDFTREVPVIFITGLTSVEDEEKGFILGAVDYITKPFNNAIVKARVKTHIQIVKHMRTIERIGKIDALTDIANRRSFDDRINEEWARAVREKHPLGLLMLDIDRFKLYNDTYGHPQGDVLLQHLAKAVESTLKRTTDFAARIGGEEFAVILPSTDLDGAMIIAEEVRSNVESAVIPNPYEPDAKPTTISIGAASLVPEQGDDLASFIARCDAALYAAKSSGKNRVCPAK